jgi:glutathione S-transferase
VAFLLRALNQPYENVFVDYMAGATRTESWRNETNEMGEVPVFEDGARRLTQSGAILTYLAAKHGRFGGKNEDERLDVLRWLLFDNHKFTSYFATYRFLKSLGPTPPDPTVMAWLKSRADAAYGIADKHLRSQPFLVGAEPTIADFSLCGYAFYPNEESGFDVPQRFPSVAAWLDRLRAIPGWADPYTIMPGQRIAPKW